LALGGVEAVLLDAFGTLVELEPPGPHLRAALAERVEADGAWRAVGRANGSNRLAIIVPCHRVVAADGALTGYRWGVERKRQLLEKEAALAPTQD
jgi:AraC family transcriptional regulator of adaptative response/methylated-DNA-[protein]-cysteine methyltransferase